MTLMVFDFDGLILDTEVPVDLGAADLRLGSLADLSLSALLARLSRGDRVTPMDP